MKITFLLPMTHICGGVRSTFEIANCLFDRGHEVSVVYPLIPQLGNWYNPRTCGNMVIEAMFNLKNGKNVEWFDLRANLINPPNLSERWIPDADIIVATNWRNALNLMKYGPEKGLKVYFVRGYETWDGEPEKVKSTYNLPIYKITSSNWLKNTVEANHETQVYGPVPNGVNFNEFHMENANFEASKPLTIGMLYRTNIFKCISDGIKALELVKEHSPESKIVIFGEQEKHNELKSLKDLGNFEFHLLPVKDKLREIYNKLDIFMFSSCSEGFGNPPMEAMACGAAVVSTDVGAISDYSIDGKTILTSKPHDPQALADNVIELIENEEKRMMIAKAGNEYIKNFSWEKSTEKLETIFKKLMEIK
jgi:glycosyltransferase involved in cell wall biosynthesis